MSYTEEPNKHEQNEQIRLATFAILKEREACARIAEYAHTAFEQIWENAKDCPFPEYAKIRKKMGEYIAAKIRQRDLPK